ncbi:hypothetical protein SS50377_26737 [Spironucleus salmonicida]|uniref:Uncharacterized protein n=1 Tax=Spironucleus salmonicida TaxID=348837 RepID=V6LY98_9EUKA|nr:hypothetical protein SS50377_26737 [Spironucleus salmonicida]|eukprot:EST49208.1 Hypothetical protein SS50377_10425 [Spironucleus salmonicida]
MTLTEKIDFFFSSFCVSFFDPTKKLVDQHKYQIPVDDLSSLLKNITASQSEILDAISLSKYLKLRDGKITVPMPQKPYDTALIMSAFPKCMPTFKAKKFLQDLTQIPNINVYDYILKSSIEQLSFCLKFDNLEDKEKFKKFFKMERAERLMKENWNDFHSYMKKAKKFYESIDQKDPAISILAKLEQFKSKVFLLEFTPEIIERHKLGVEQFYDVKAYRRENNRRDYLQRKGLWKEDLNPKIDKKRQKENTRYKVQKK